MPLLFILFLACLANASFNISPTVIKMRVSRGEYNTWAEIGHSSGNIVPVELIMYERIIDFDGNIKDTIVPTKDFVINPSQILLSPNQKVKVQIVYRARQKVDTDRVYSLMAKERPIPEGAEETSEATAGIVVLVNYNVPVALETGKPGILNFVSSKSLDSGKVELIMENKGKGRFSFEDMNLYVGKEKIAEFTGGKNSVMPGQKRRFVFKHPKPLKANEAYFAK